MIGALCIPRGHRGRCADLRELGPPPSPPALTAVQGPASVPIVPGVAHNVTLFGHPFVVSDAVAVKEVPYIAWEINDDHYNLRAMCKAMSTTTPTPITILDVGGNVGALSPNSRASSITPITIRCMIDIDQA
jgi:hypothetical protein